ncbi:MAG: hypothetical protein ACYSU8_03965, partial [Planctomycetota bacterium]
GSCQQLAKVYSIDSSIEVFEPIHPTIGFSVEQVYDFQYCNAIQINCQQFVQQQGNPVPSGESNGGSCHQTGEYPLFFS